MCAQQPHAGKQRSSGQIQVAQASMSVLCRDAQALCVPCLCMLKRRLHVCCCALHRGCIGVQQYMQHGFCIVSTATETSPAEDCGWISKRLCHGLWHSVPEVWLRAVKITLRNYCVERMPQDVSMEMRGFACLEICKLPCLQRLVRDSLIPMSQVA